MLEAFNGSQVFPLLYHILCAHNPMKIVISICSGEESLYSKRSSEDDCRRAPQLV